MILTDPRRSVALGLAFVLLGVVAGCGKGKTDPASSPNVAPPAQPTNPNSPNTGDEKKLPVNFPTGKADFSMTAEEFSKECLMDKKAAEKKYDGKVIELTGILNGIILDADLKSTLQLRAGRNVFDCIFCDTKEKEPWAKLTPGQQVKIRGKCSGNFLAAIGLDDCDFLPLSPNPAIAFAIEDLVKQYTQQREITEKRYKQIPLIVEGEILQKMTGGAAGECKLILQGQNKSKLICDMYRLMSPDKTIADPFKVGQRLKVVGKLDLFAADDGGPKLYDCLPINSPK